MASLRDYTSLRVGGEATRFVEVSSESEIIAAIEAAGDSPILIIGGGTNILVADSGFDGTVIRVSNNKTESEIDACSGATLTIGAGADWDRFVSSTITRGFAGLETLSAIPGTVGAAPIQNIGAYGHEVSEFITQVRTYDRQSKAIKTFTNSECEFEYRNSIFKKNPGRYVVISVQFQLRIGQESTPITYLELAKKLGINQGEKALVTATRDAVIELRRSKGMVLDRNDRDSWSAGSFFTNPIVTAEVAASLPADAPRWPTSSGLVKVSAAWLIENSGIRKGDTSGGAKISSKHVLALTNAGNATAEDLCALARKVQLSVSKTFKIELTPEVNLVGVKL
jgi:UDP-N-acetylmuramate dehydrogenase